MNQCRVNRWKAVFGKKQKKPNIPNHAEWGAACRQPADFRIYDELMTTAPADSPNFPQSRFFALIPCAGQGSRAGTSLAKQYQLIAGKALVLHTLSAFAAVSRLEKTLVVVAPGDSFFGQSSSNPSFEVVDCGGASRADSVVNGLQALRLAGAQDHDWVLVHDAARCLISPSQIDRLMDACAGDEVGGLLALKLPDTLKREADGRVAATVDRADKWLAQTPQMFRLGALAKALHGAGDSTTDESSAIEAMGLRPKLVAGSAENFKVTYAEDFRLAEAILLGRKDRLNAGPA